jgi:aminopeptidase-like protein/aminoglycoside N3'-acetyltransferase
MTDVVSIQHNHHSALSYSASDLVDGMRRIGITAGDTVFFQTCVETLGQALGCASSREICEMLWKSLSEVVGPRGTILVPTYTFSFCRQEIFDIDNSPTIWGEWNTFFEFSEYFRKLPGAIRSADPIFSTAGIGPKAAEILTDLPKVCLGEDCVHDRLRRVGGKICILGVGLYESIFRHHMEATTRLPWRFDKLFTGFIREQGQVRKEGWIYNVRIWASNADPAGERLEAIARETGLCRVAPVGRGEILAVKADEFRALIIQELTRDPWFSVKGPAGDPVALEDTRVGGPRYEVKLPPQASMKEMIDELWRLPRDIISDGYDAALRGLSTQAPMRIHEYPSGTHCWTWIVPEKWTCFEACLESIDGKRIFSSADHPLHVVRYSLPFEGEVTRDELFKHLHVHPRLSDSIPFIFKYYERDWGLCCSQEQKTALCEERYRVRITTKFSFGTLKVGEVIAKGASDDCIVLCAHLCHPSQVNDDLTGVVVGLNVMRELLKRRDLRYTYRFLIVPETIGSVAYLSQNEHLLPKMKGGLFLEMLGTQLPHALQLSFAGNTEIDRCLELVLKEQDPKSWTGAFRSLIGNDENQFNAPGVRVPMLSLSRILSLSEPEWPFREYHSDRDTPQSVSIGRLEESSRMVLKMVDALEANLVPINQFKGEVFCSRYGLHIDWYTNRKGSETLFDVMHLIDGSHSIADIAQKVGISFDAAKRIIDEMDRQDLISYRQKSN